MSVRDLPETGLWSQQGILLCDDNGIVVDVNEAAQALLGVSAEDMRGCPCHAALERLIPFSDGHVEADAVARNNAASLDWLRGGVTCLLYEHGSPRRVRVEAMRMRDISGARWLEVISLSDVSLAARIEERQACILAAARILAGARRLDEIIPGLVRAVRDTLRWDVGGFWSVDDAQHVMRCEFVESAGAVGAEFAARSQQMTMDLGIDVPGRVWLGGKAVWETRVAEVNSPRTLLARRDKLHTVVGVPIRIGIKVHGVLEFLSRHSWQHDAEILNTLSIVAEHIARFVAVLQAQEEINVSRGLLTTMLDRFPIILLRVEASRTIKRIEGQGLEQVGLMPGELIGQPLDVLIPRSPVITSAIKQALEGRTVVTDISFGQVPMQACWIKAEGDNAITGVLTLNSQSTMGQRAADSQHPVPWLDHSATSFRVSPRTARRGYQAGRDNWTGLPTRPVLLEGLKQAVEAQDQREEGVALAILGVSSGHWAARAREGQWRSILTQIATRLTETVAPTATVAHLRFGEFAILMPASDFTGANHHARTILEALQAPVTVKGHSQNVDWSIGIALHPQHGPDGAILLRHADVALALARHLKSGYATYLLAAVGE